MISNFIVVGKIYNMDKSIDSRREGMSMDNFKWKSQMIWVNINTQKIDKKTGEEKNINKTFTLWNKDVNYAKKLMDGDIVVLECHVSSKQNKDGVWNDYWAVDKFEIIGKLRPKNEDNDDSDQEYEQQLKKQEEIKKQRQKADDELLTDDILWD